MNGLGQFLQASGVTPQRNQGTSQRSISEKGCIHAPEGTHDPSRDVLNAVPGGVVRNNLLSRVDEVVQTFGILVESGLGSWDDNFCLVHVVRATRRLVSPSSDSWSVMDARALTPVRTNRPGSAIFYM